MPAESETPFLSIAGEIVFKVLSLVILITQLGVLDYYVIHFAKDDDKGALWWILLTDVFIVLAWIETLGHWLFSKVYKRIWTTLKHCMKRTKDQVDAGEGDQGNEAVRLRTAYLAWFFYSAFGLVPRVAVIFADNKNVEKLSGSPSSHAANVIKIVIASTAILFVTLNNAHRNAKAFSRRRFFLERLSAGITWDILDSVELLDTLVRLENPAVPYTELPRDTRNAIVAFVCVSLVIPTVALLEMRQQWKEGSLGRRRLNFKMLYILSNLLFVDVSYLVIRLILWHKHDLQISEFFVKNLICIYLNVNDIWEFWGPNRPWKCPDCGELIIEQYVHSHKEMHRMSQGNVSEGTDMETDSTVFIEMTPQQLS